MLHRLAQWVARIVVSVYGVVGVVTTVAGIALPYSPAELTQPLNSLFARHNWIVFAGVSILFVAAFHAWNEERERIEELEEHATLTLASPPQWTDFPAKSEALFSIPIVNHGESAVRDIVVEIWQFGQSDNVEIGHLEAGQLHDCQIRLVPFTKSAPAACSVLFYYRKEKTGRMFKKVEDIRLENATNYAIYHRGTPETIAPRKWKSEMARLKEHAIQQAEKRIRFRVMGKSGETNA